MTNSTLECAGSIVQFDVWAWAPAHAMDAAMAATAKNFRKFITTPQSFSCEINLLVSRSVILAVARHGVVIRHHRSMRPVETSRISMYSNRRLFRPFQEILTCCNSQTVAAS